MKKLLLIITCFVVFLVFYIFLADTQKTSFVSSDTSLENTSWELIQYNDSLRSQKIHGTDWFITFDSKTTGYLKLCEEYPFAYIYQNNILTVSFTGGFEKKLCQDESGIEQAIISLFKKQMTLQKITNTLENSIKNILVLKNEDIKLASIIRENNGTQNYLTPLFNKKEILVTFDMTVDCPLNIKIKPCPKQDVAPDLSFKILPVETDSATQQPVKIISFVNSKSTSIELLPNTYQVILENNPISLEVFKPIIFSVTNTTVEQRVPLTLTLKSSY